MSGEGLCGGCGYSMREICPMLCGYGDGDNAERPADSADEANGSEHNNREMQLEHDGYYASDDDYDEN